MIKMFVFVVKVVWVYVININDDMVMVNVYFFEFYSNCVVELVK